jgi:hypothetical protein
LPDGIFSNQKCQFKSFLDCPAMKDVGQFYGYYAYFTAIWYILWPLGTFWSVWYIYFSRLGMLHQEKSGNTGKHPSKHELIAP